MSAQATGFSSATPAVPVGPTSTSSTSAASEIDAGPTYSGPGHCKSEGGRHAGKHCSVAESPDVVMIDMNAENSARKTDWTGLLEFLNQKVCYSDTRQKVRQPTMLLQTQEDTKIQRHKKLWWCMRRLIAILMQPKKVEEVDANEPLAEARTCVGKWVMTPQVQICVMVAIMTDIISMIYKVSKDPGGSIGFGGSGGDEVFTEAQLTIFLVIDWIVCVVLGVEVLCRVFYFGQKFTYLYLNILEFSLVPVMLVELLTRDEDVNIGIPVPLLRTLRPVIRCINLMAKAARGFTHAVKLRNAIQEQVAGTHKRYISEGFNLDLCFINAQVIAMGRPGIGKDALFNNPLSEVVRFFDTKHKDKFIIINTSDHVTYSAWNFHQRIIRFPISEHSVPRLVDLNELCAAMKTFLDHDQDHVIAVHGHAGGGQVGLVIAAYLLYCGAFRQAISAMSNYERTRTAPGATETVQGFDSASQRRFVEYFSSCVHELHCVPCEGSPDPPIRAKLLSIRLLGVDMEALGGVNVRIFLRKQRPKKRHCIGDIEQSTSTTPKSQNREEKSTTTKGSEFKEEEDGNDENLQEEDEAVMLMMQEEMALMQLAQEEKNKHKFDAVSSGCLPQPGIAFIDTNENAESSSTGKVLVQQGDDPLDTGNILGWRFEDIEIAGEICVEVHANRPAKKRKSHKMKGSHMEKIRTKMLSARSVQSNVSNTKDGDILPAKSQDTSDYATSETESRMLFCAWFHTSFLEANQSMSLRRELGDKSIGVTLGRFNVDKAAGAPSLQTYGASFQMQLMFEVEEGLDTRPRNTVERMSAHDDSSAKMELTRLHPPNSDTDVSEMGDIGWLTWFVNKLWPYTEVALVRLIREVVEPLLQDSMPGPFKSIHFETFTLGRSTPQLGPVVASHRSGDSKGLQLDLPIKYRGDVNILMATGVAEIGINQIVLNGILSILLDPIVDELPIVGGIKLFFLNPPKVKLQFVGLAALGTSIPGMEKKVETTIHDALAGSLVLPNVLSIGWRPEIWESGDPTVELSNRLPTGVLRVVVLEARGLSVENMNRLYVTLTFGANKQQTPACKKSGYHETRWDETCDLLYYDPQQVLVMEVSVKEGISKTDRVIARSQNIQADSLLRSSSGPQWVILDGVAPVGGAWSKASRGRANTIRHSKLFSTTPKMPQSDTTSRLLLYVQLNELIADSQFLPKDDEAAGAVSNLDRNVPTALLIVNVVKARVPADRMQGTSICVRVGDMEVDRKCTAADETWKNFVELTRDSTVNAIEVLVREGFTSDRIAKVLKKPEPLVNKVMAHCLGYNVTCAQHMCVLVKPTHLSQQNGGNIEFEIKRKGRVEASTKMALKTLVDAPSMRIKKYVKLQSGPAGSTFGRRRDRKGENSQTTVPRYDIDAELQLFAFSAAKTGADNEEGRQGTTPKSHSNVSAASKQTLQTSPAEPTPEAHEAQQANRAKARAKTSPALNVSSL